MPGTRASTLRGQAERHTERPGLLSGVEQRFLAGARSPTHPLGSVTRDRLPREKRRGSGVRLSVCLSVRPSFCHQRIARWLALARAFLPSLAPSRPFSPLRPLSPSLPLSPPSGRHRCSSPDFSLGPRTHTSPPKSPTNRYTRLGSDNPGGVVTRETHPRGRSVAAEEDRRGAEDAETANARDPGYERSILEQRPRPIATGSRLEAVPLFPRPTEFRPRTASPLFVPGQAGSAAASLSAHE